MRLACLAHSAGVGLAATSAGLDAWMDWLERKPSRPIEVTVVGGAGAASGLPHFPEASVGGLPMSERALDVLGESAFKFIGQMAVQGVAAPFTIGYPWRTDTMLVMDGRRIADPMRLQPGLPSPHGRVFQSSRGITGLKGTYFVTLDTWLRIEGAGLTGLVKVGEYEVLPA